MTHPRRSAEKSGAGTWPFDKPPYLTLNLAIGDNWGGQKGIDYVRVYRRKQPYLPRFSLSTVYAMNAMHISSVVCSPHVTGFGGRLGLLRFFSELS